MRKLLLSSACCGLLLTPFVNSTAEPIDQAQYAQQIPGELIKHHQRWEDGRIYDGEWWNDRPQGQGMLTYPDGGQYWGRFHLGMRQGEGLMKFVNGDEYEGEWFGDKPQGRGTLRFATGARYEGQFQQGEQSGKGRQTYADGTYYDGEWVHNAPHGEGRLTFASGGVYEGQFLQGKPHGQGSFYFSNGDLYEGDWNQGQQDGSGRIHYATGGFYEGNIKAGQRQGKGLWVTALGQRYEGNFSNNLPDGKGSCGTQESMEPCTYHNGKRVMETAHPVVVAVKAPEPAISASAVPPSSALVRSIVRTPTPAAPHHPPAAIIPPVAIKPPAIASKPHSAERNINAKGLFSKTLQKEKQTIQARTLADLDPTRSELFFGNDSPNNLVQAQSGRAWWIKRSSLFQDELKIISRHGNAQIQMIVSHYQGPGDYKLDNVLITAPDHEFTVGNNEAGSIRIVSDANGWISGEFQFSAQTQNGQLLQVKDGIFHLSDVSNQPNFLH